MRCRTWIALGLLASSAACKSPETHKEPAPAASASALAKPPEPPQAVAQAPSDPPTEADFEDEATQAITKANLEEQLDKLEHEIGNP